MAQYKEFPFPLFNEAMQADTERKMLGCWTLISKVIAQLSSANATQTIWELFSQY